MKKEFKFLETPTPPTLQEKKDYAQEFSKPYRWHKKGCLISKSAYRLFVIKDINENPELTYEDIEKLILYCCVDPNTIPDGETFYAGQYIEEDPYDDIYIETVHNEENLPHFYFDKYKVDSWEEEQDRNTEENEMNLHNI